MATDDYISRAEALDFLISRDGITISDADARTIGDRFVEHLQALPAADVRENRRATWIKQSVSFDLCGIEYFACSACAKEQQLKYHFCPWCGAAMRRVDDGSR